MSNGGKIRYSRALKCFECGSPFVERVGEDGRIYGGFFFVQLGDPTKYERICPKCNERIGELRNKYRTKNHA